MIISSLIKSIVVYLLKLKCRCGLLSNLQFNAAVENAPREGVKNPKISKKKDVMTYYFFGRQRGELTGISVCCTTL